MSEYSFDLPSEQIAEFPVEPRDHSRLLKVDRAAGTTAHHVFYDLPRLLKRGDLLVFNETKVIPARLRGKTSHQGTVEVFLTEQVDRNSWRCLLKPGRKFSAQGKLLTFPGGVTAEVTKEKESPEGIVRFSVEGPDFETWLDAHGSVPLPPYLKREADTLDKLRYQTVYAKHPGSVAAPTAGLHFTPEVFKNLSAAAIQVAYLTLRVGLGTFLPLEKTHWEQGRLHGETYSVSERTLEALHETRKAGGRVIPVGTTTLRALESLETYGPSGRTDLFIRPGFQFRWTDGLITNFHLPDSSLFVLVSSFLGKDVARRAYEEAIAEKYRFYSYGDAMLAV